MAGQPSARTSASLASSVLAFSTDISLVSAPSSFSFEAISFAMASVLPVPDQYITLAFIYKTSFIS